MIVNGQPACPPCSAGRFSGLWGTSRYVQAIFGRHSQLEGALQFCRLSSVGIHGEDGSWLLCSCRVPTGTVFLSLRTISNGIYQVSKLVFK